MAKLAIGASFALLCLGSTALAQDIRAVKPALLRTAAVDHESFDANMARLAVKAATQPSAQPTRQELLGVILLMSLRQQKASGT